MTTMAEVIAATTGCELVHAESVATSLTKAGFGHVPTALNEAADALKGRLDEEVSNTDEEGFANPFNAGYVTGHTNATVQILCRARAAETGGTE